MNLKESLEVARNHTAINKHMAQLVLEETMSNADTSDMDARSVRHSAFQCSDYIFNVLKRLRVPIPEEAVFNGTADQLYAKFDSSRTVEIRP